MKSIGRLLDEYLEGCTAFDWEKHNCCQYCLNWLAYRKSPDHVAGFDKVSRFQIGRLLKTHGDLVSVCAHFLGRPPVPVTQLQIGDVVALRPDPDTQAVGILAGSTVAVLSPTGIGHVRVSRTMVGWKIQS